MRRAAAGWVLSLALLAASVAWFGLTLQRTAFDATRSQRVADVLLTDTQVRGALAGRIVNSIDAGLPPELRRQVPTDQLVGVAENALAAPEVRSALEAALVNSHRYLLGEIEQPPVLDVTALDPLVRQGVAQIRPDLAELAPKLPPIQVPLPDTGLRVARTVRSIVNQVTTLAALAALALAVFALVVTSDRPRVLRRIGRWAIGAGALWVALRFGVPPLARAVAPSSAALIVGLATAVVERMVVPGAVLVGAGAICTALAGVLSALRKRREKAERAQRTRPRPIPRAGSVAAISNGGADPELGAGVSPAPVTSATPGAGDGAGRGSRRARRRAKNEAAALDRAARAAQAAREGSPAGAGVYGLPEDGTQADTGHGYAIAGTSRTSPSAGAAAETAPRPRSPFAQAMEWQGDAPHLAGAPAEGTESASAASAIFAGGAPLPGEVREEPFGASGPEAAVIPPLTDRPRRRDDIQPNFPGNWLGGFNLDPRQHPRLADPAPPPPRWIDGVGYVYSYPPHDSARWVEGLGYVVDLAETVGEAAD